jgi:hypothetical protein
MLKTKKTTEAKEICESGICKSKLKTLLMQKMPGTFDREPAASFNGNLDKLVEEIINLQ